jgi:hypothetical protein
MKAGRHQASGYRRQEIMEQRSFERSGDQETWT